ncbi:MAG: hypothetical protein ACRC3H_19585 [Lachnospiraceae bacterium]
MSTEQWETEGKCQECRKKNYCTKPCKARQQRTSFEMYQAFDAATKGVYSRMLTRRY